MIGLGWAVANRVFRGLEWSYCRVLRLEPVGPLLYIGRRTYRGPQRELGGMQIRPGDPVGIMHFNNGALQEAQADRNEANGGFVFARLLVKAMRVLAERVERDPAYAGIRAFYGITWIPPHGQRLGFVIEPLPDSWRARWLRFYFRTLLFAFNPRASRQMGGALRPQRFWMPRDGLLTHFGGGRSPR